MKWGFLRRIEWTAGGERRLGRAGAAMAQIKGPAEQSADRAARLVARDLGVRLSPHATQGVLFESDRLDHACPWLFPTVVFCTVFWLNRING